MKTAYSYIRFSSKPQERGDSIRRQTAGSEALARKHGWTLSDKTLTDLKVSGFHGKNWRDGELAGFLEAIKRGSVKKGSVLIVESLDRLSRDDIDEALPLFLGIIKSGVDIATCDPERIYDRQAIKNPVQLLEPLFIFARANEESTTKSHRISEAWATKRKQLMAKGGKKMTAQVPGWITLSPEKTKFSLNEGATIIKRIVKLALDGHGSTAIVKILNAEQVPSTGRSKTGWNKSYVRRILSNRALIGEYQPYIGHTSNGRQPVGDPIPDYFPRLITDEVFYKIQTAVRGKPGKVGTGTPNIFTGLLFDQRDGSTITLTRKNGGAKQSQRLLVNSSAQRGVKDAVYCSFPYAVLEKVFVHHYLPEIKPADLALATAIETDTTDLETQLADLDHRIGKIKTRLAKEDDLDALLDVLSTLTKKRQAVQGQLEQANESKHQQQAKETLAECKRLRDLVDDDTRRRLKAKIKRLIQRIDMLIEKKGVARLARVSMKFHNGKQRTFSIVVKRGEYWHKWTEGDKAEQLDADRVWSTMSEFYMWSTKVK